MTRYLHYTHKDGQLLLKVIDITLFVFNLKNDSSEA
jgi:hypothetical protein